MEEKKRKRLVLIDGHSILFRAFHAYPHLTTSQGELINAVYGFTNILLSVVRELEPTHLAVCFDRAKPTFRHKEYKGYKAHRPEMPADLAGQQERVEEVVSVLNIPIFALEGYEADDVIATLAKQAIQKLKTPAIRNTTSRRLPIRPFRESVTSVGRQNSKLKRNKDDIEVVIVTGDRDALQLVDGKRVMVYAPGRGKQAAGLWDVDAVKERYGLKPEQLDDLKALAGDASDEIPGVRGIGPKTATALVQAYSDLDGVYNRLKEVKTRFGEAVFQKLASGKQSAYLSHKLAELMVDVPIKLELPKCEVSDYDKKCAVSKFRELEFSSLIAKLPDDSFEQMVQEELL